mgnify:CR=1 FL=1
MTTADDGSLIWLLELLCTISYVDVCPLFISTNKLKGEPFNAMRLQRGDSITEYPSIITAGVLGHLINQSVEKASRQR